jgi:hypothetical protein
VYQNVSLHLSAMKTADEVVRLTGTDYFAPALD